MQNSKVKMQNYNVKFKKGIYFALITALISGVSVFINGFASKTFSDPYLFTTAKNIIVAAFLTSAAIGLISKSKLKKLQLKEWGLLVLMGLIGGSIPFLLFFKGLSLTTSTMAAFIHKTLFIWATIIAVFWLKEKITWHYLIGLGAMLIGAIILFPFKDISVGMGEVLALFATLLWSIEAVIIRRISNSKIINLEPLILSWGRMFFGSLLMAGFLIWTNRMSGVLEFSYANWLWVIATSILLIGYVGFWYTSLKYAPVVLAASILALGFPITAALQAIFITHIFSLDLILGLMISLVAIWMLIVGASLCVRPNIEDRHMGLSLQN